MAGLILGYVMSKGAFVIQCANKTSISEIEQPYCRKSEMKRFIRVFFGRKIVIFGTAVIVLLLVTAIFAPFLATHDPDEPDYKASLARPSMTHLLGTDVLGRDTLSRIIFGSRTALIVGFVAVGFAATVGMSLGLIAGFFGGFINTIIMRLMDALMSIPMILLAVTISALLGGGIQNVVIALGVALVPAYARLMCSQVMIVMQSDYITASRAMGATNLRIMLRHVVMNCFPPLIVLLTMQVGMAITSEASLSFLGIGIKPPAAAWGSMVYEGYQRLMQNPVLSIAPGAAIMLVVFAFNMVGDGLRDALDPKLRGAL
jgi:ABC-type dipeptide/oligopeptide/nickel transport system permease subunit